jgi:hypothetical protein
LGLTVKREPTTFDTENRKDNAFQQHFFTKNSKDNAFQQHFFTKNSKDNAPMALQYHP